MNTPTDPTKPCAGHNHAFSRDTGLGDPCYICGHRRACHGTGVEPTSVLSGPKRRRTFKVNLVNRPEPTKAVGDTDVPKSAPTKTTGSAELTVEQQQIHDLLCVSDKHGLDYCLLDGVMMTWIDAIQAHAARQVEAAVAKARLEEVESLVMLRAEPIGLHARDKAVDAYIGQRLAQLSPHTEPGQPGEMKR